MSISALGQPRQFCGAYYWSGLPLIADRCADIAREQLSANYGLTSGEVEEMPGVFGRIFPR